MKISIDGIGKIHNSSVSVNGLTVISGENDTGKSTVGKTLFSIIQAFTTFPYILAKQSRERFQRDFERLYYEIRRYIDVSDNKDIRTFFSIARGGLVANENIPTHVLLTMAKDVLGNLVIDAETRDRINAMMQKLDEENRRPEVGDKIMRDSLNKILLSEFPNDIVCKMIEHPAKVEVSDGVSKILEFTVDNKGIKEFSNSGPLGFKNVTLVDGPSILQYYPAISEFDSTGEKRMRRGAVPFHIMDLASKIQGVKRNIDLLGEVAPNKFPEALTGNLKFDEKSHSFLYDTGKYTINSNNVASGIKTLALFDLLVMGEYVNSENLLILDEPETNLHPKWQVQYAKVICDLVRGGAKVLVNTHSPYMLEALKGYSRDIANVDFYLSRVNSDGYADLKNTQGDITQIIEILSQPLVDLVNELSALQ